MSRINKKDGVNTSKIVRAFTILFFSGFLKLHGQSVTVYDPFGNTNLIYSSYHFFPFPFDSVIVLDNRKDTSCILINEDGLYQAEVLNFTIPAAEGIKNYIKSFGKRRSSVSSRTVVINLKQLRAFNKNFLFKKHISPKDKVNNFLWKTHGILMFSADIYLQTKDSNYKKFISINRKYNSPNYFDKACVKKVVDEMMDAITLFYIDSIFPKPKEPYKFKRILEERKEYVKLLDTAQISLADINNNTRNNYLSYPILNNTFKGNGFYLTFEDLRDNIITRGTFFLKNYSIDSGYTLMANIRDTVFKNHYPYAIQDSSKLFIRVFDDKYSELNIQHNTLSFDVPKSLPNMYSILSSERLDLKYKTYYYEGSVAGGLIGTSVVIGMDRLNREKINRMERNREDKGEFRHCVIDMLDGDYIY